MALMMIMLTSSNGNIVRAAGPWWGESSGHRWIPLTKASDAELWCFRWRSPEQTNGWTNSRDTRDTGELRRHGAHYNAIVMMIISGLHLAHIKTADLAWHGLFGLWIDRVAIPYVQMNVWKNEWMNEWMNRRTDGCVEGCILQAVICILS